MPGGKGQENVSSTVENCASASVVDDEISLLDLLLVVAENFWLLVLGSCSAAVLGFVAAGFFQPTYVSKAVLHGERLLVVGGKEVPLFSPAEVAQLATSAATLSGAASALAQTGFAAEAQGLQAQAASGSSSGTVKASVVRNSPSISLEVSASNAPAAQATLQAVIDALLAQSRPQGDEFATLQANLQRDMATLERSRAIEASLAQQISSAGASGPQAASAYGNVLAAITALSASVAEQQARLQGLPADSVLVPPTLPQQPAKPKRALITVLSGLVAGFVLLLWVFVRQSWRNAQADPAALEKIQRIRLALTRQRSVA